MFFIQSETSNTGASEKLSLAGVVIGNKTASDWSAKNYKFDFFDMKGIFERLSETFNLKGYQLSDAGMPEYFHPFKSCSVVRGKQVIGYFGAINPIKANVFDVPADTIIFEFDFNGIKAIASDNRRFKELPKFPYVERDFSVLVNNKVTAQA
jgi:phenylalanyl-tRNA synthetase beta chain